MVIVWGWGAWLSVFVRLLGGRHPVSAAYGQDSGHAEAGQVDCRGEEGEVGCDFRAAAHPGAAPAVAVSHQVGELAFDLGPGGPVVGLPVRVGAAGTCPAQLLLVLVDSDRPPGLGGGAPGGQGTGGAGRAEAGDAAAVLGRADRGGGAVRAGHLPFGQVDDEVGLGVPATAVDR